MDTIQIGERPVGEDHATYVIAEAGINHDGELQRAKELIDAAADADADAVKFQTFRSKKLFVESAAEDDSILDTFEQLEMPYDWIPTLSEYADKRGITFLSTPFDPDSVDALADYVPAFKIASSSLTDHPLLRYVAQTGKPMIVSTGVHTRSEIAEAVAVLEEEEADFALLHCVSSYPTPLDQIRVSMVEQLNEWFDVQIGLSDHTEDPVTAPTAAVALGATVVEKHLTTDSSREGADHSMALEPDELSSMVDAIRRTESAIGTPYENVHEAEQSAYENSRRSVYATDKLNAGDKLTKSSISILRCNGRKRGVPPSQYESLLGKRVVESVERHSPITESLIEQT